MHHIKSHVTIWGLNTQMHVRTHAHLFAFHFTCSLFSNFMAQVRQSAPPPHTQMNSVTLLSFSVYADYTYVCICVFIYSDYVVGVCACGFLLVYLEQVGCFRLESEFRPSSKGWRDYLCRPHQKSFTPAPKKFQG